LSAYDLVPFGVFHYRKIIPEGENLNIEIHDFRLLEMLFLSLEYFIPK